MSYLLQHSLIQSSEGDGKGRPLGEGVGVHSLEKGTDCGLTAAELWLLRAKIAKKEGLSSHYECA